MLASTIGLIGHPFYVAFAWVLVGLFVLVADYAIAIALLTILVMVALFPVTLKGTRAMTKMQLLAPQLKKIQDRHKTTPEMSIESRNEERRALAEETTALYKENSVSMIGSFLPILLQLPVFLILNGTIRGLTNVRSSRLLSGALATQPDPLYISTRSRLYVSIVHARGALDSFGINLAHSLRTAGPALGAKAPYLLLVLIAVGLQYLQMRQLSGRDGAGGQSGRLQKAMPLVFGLVYLAIPAGVNVYFIVASLFRLAQQELMHRRDPQLRSAIRQLRGATGGPEAA